MNQLYHDFSTSLKVEQQNQPRADAFYKSHGALNIKRYDYNNPAEKKFQQDGIDCSVEYYTPGLDVFWLNYSEKFRTVDTGDMCIELWSDYDNRIPGWALHDKSDTILYVTPEYFYEVTNNEHFKQMVQRLVDEWNENALRDFVNNDGCVRQLVKSKDGYGCQLIKSFSKNNNGEKYGNKWMGICICIPWQILLKEFFIDINMYDNSHNKLDINKMY